MPAAIQETFEEVLMQHERRIHFYIHRLHIRDPHKDFYQEGLVALWQAYENYEPGRGVFSTYLNYSIRNRLIDLVRKKQRNAEHTEYIEQGQRVENESGNHIGKGMRSKVLYDGTDIVIEDNIFLSKVRDLLSENQWKWVCLFIVDGMSIKEIAEQEGTSTDAVKSWGREVRKKLRNVGFGIE